MRRIVLVSLIAIALAIPASAQMRLDVGIEIPKGAGLVSSGSVEAFEEVATALEDYWIPFPTASIYYQWDLGPINIGAGIRAYSFIIATFGWPNVFAEVELGPVFVEAQIGGGLFGYFALNGGGVEAGKVFIPDLSAWLALGPKKVFRIGAGGFGLYIPELTGSDTIPFLFYISAKAAIPL